MLISSMKAAPYSYTPARSALSAAPSDVTSPDLFSPAARNVAVSIATGAGFAVAGGLPVIGAGANVFVGLGTGFAGKEPLSYVNFAGAVANLAGSGTLVGAALSGSSTAASVGFALLGVSAVTAGTVSGYLQQGAFA